MRRTRIKVILSLLLICGCTRTADVSPVVLYNGIILPDIWPPRYEEPSERSPMPVPYLTGKPAVISIDVGRQLFVDDFLVSHTTLETVCHKPRFYQGNPVIAPEELWEKTRDGVPYAAPFSDGVWYDERDNKFKMWFLTGASAIGGKFCTAYAESADGRNWIKPALSLIPGTSIVDTCDRDAATLWLDKQETDPAKRFKLFNVEKNSESHCWQFILKYSPDGIHWSKGVAQSGDILDRSSAFYNPFRKVWGLSLRHRTDVSSRSRAYLEADDAETAVSLAHRLKKGARDHKIVFWFVPDSLERHHPDFQEVDPGIYHFDCIPYESILLGQYTVWQGPDNTTCQQYGIQKRNEVMLGYSRDGFHFYRPTHEAFLSINPTDNAWNWGNVQSVGGSPLLIGDSLYFYCSGRRLNKYHWDGYSSCGLATLRRDGFVSRRAGSQGGSLTTEILIFKGKHLFVNANVSGSLQIDILSEKNEILHHGPSISTFDSTKKMIMDVSKFAGKRIKLHFSLTDGDLYAFWVSPFASGESLGYTAGGGPGLSPSGRDEQSP